MEAQDSSGRKPSVLANSLPIIFNPISPAKLPSDFHCRSTLHQTEQNMNNHTPLPLRLNKKTQKDVQIRPLSLALTSSHEPGAARRASMKLAQRQPQSRASLNNGSVNRLQFSPSPRFSDRTGDSFSYRKQMSSPISPMSSQSARMSYSLSSPSVPPSTPTDSSSRPLDTDSGYGSPHAHF
eukprot:c16314_g1_i2.p1 GENE.c16314_g1_i2~~c16314_g1_i2.p1  ORF type:complete len:195 (+),score=18.95 c16314_g1_i2:44-586(+)